jgi:POT family proton-dependent oligopeptide transporter
MLERASYYGLRSLIVLYMVGESLKMDETEAISTLVWFSALLIISQIIGAILGDLVIGNRKSIIWGGVIQTIGAFSLSIPSTMGLYIGLFLLILGGGLYTPNIVSNFGKLYLTKTKLLDAAFTVFYLAINLGSFLGVLLIGYWGEKYGWTIGFIMAGVLMLLSIIPILCSKESKSEKAPNNPLTTNQKVIKISITFLLVALFWAIYKISDIRFYNLQLELTEISQLGIAELMWSSFSSVIMLPISFLAFLLWTYFYSSQLFKLNLGFIFASISYSILFIIPEIPTEQHVILYWVALFFLNISEIHLAPIIHSVLTEYSKPKYLAIIISLAFIPTRIFSLIVGLFSAGLYEKPSVAILIGMLAMTSLSIGLIIYHLMQKKAPYYKAT